MQNKSTEKKSLVSEEESKLNQVNCIRELMALGKETPQLLESCSPLIFLIIQLLVGGGMGCGEVDLA